ncbi:hypothetical protein BDD12DRAFT_233190 [Trichophaea hybrida]|nr:hypothetical protein BDD12DRAFT_233190 [Trichophaea hybrida]
MTNGLFLENQTNAIVESIQSLLEAIKSDASATELGRHIETVSEIVGGILQATESAGNGARGWEWVVTNLRTCRERMRGMMEDPGEREGGKVGKEFKSKLAGLAFDMARETKELVRTVEEVDDEARRAMGVNLS